MGQEIERKFLVTGDGWRDGAATMLYRQGYLAISKEVTVRVRLAGNRAYLTVKGKLVGITRSEYEYEIPFPDGEEMLSKLCEKPLIEKRRYHVLYKGMTWEIDEFLGENSGLIIAEVELVQPEQSVELPAWLGQEVTGEFKYCNAALVKNPYQRWR